MRELGVATLIRAVAERLSSMLFPKVRLQQGETTHKASSEQHQGRQYSKWYRSLCEAIEANAVDKMGRTLTHAERLAIWDAGSLMMLERVDQAIHFATTAADVEQALIDFGTSFQVSRLQDMQSGAKKLNTALGRPLTDEERDQFEGVDTLYEAMVIIERVLDSELSQRELLLHSLLFNDT